MSDKIRNRIFQCAAVLLLAGAVLYLPYPIVGSYVFATGSAGLAICHLTTPIDTTDYRARRLKRYQVLIAVLCLIASVLMFKGRKEWIICLTIVAIFQTYLAFISPTEKK